MKTQLASVLGHHVVMIADFMEKASHIHRGPYGELQLLCTFQTSKIVAA